MLDTTRPVYTACLHSCVLLLYHVFIDERRHEGDGKGFWTVPEELCDLLILQTDHVLSIHLGQEMVDQHTIPVEKEENGWFGVNTRLDPIEHVMSCYCIPITNQ